MTKLEKIRQALADYVHSEGCTCCQSIEPHNAALSALAALLNVGPYSDGSGYDLRPFRSSVAQGRAKRNVLDDPADYSADAMILRGLLKRFMACRDKTGVTWVIGASKNGGDSLNKVYLDAKKYLGLPTGVKPG